MTSFRAKLWTGVGVAVLIGAGGIADACSKPAKAPAPASSAAVLVRTGAASRPPLAKAARQAPTTSSRPFRPTASRPCT